MRGAGLALASAAVLAACGSAPGTKGTVGQGAAERAATAAGPSAAGPSAAGPSAYVILGTGGYDRGWDVLEALDAELPRGLGDRIQARGLVSGASGDVMVRFAGDCAGGRDLVEAVRAAARRRGVEQVRCQPTLPE